MKQKGTCENASPGIRHRETTWDELIRVISLRDDAGLSWTAMGQRLGINRGTAQKVNDFNTLLLVFLLLTRGSGKVCGGAKENGTPSNHLRTGRPPIFDDAETASGRLCHARCVNKAHDLGRNMPGNGLRLLCAHCKECDGLHGIS